MKISEIRDLSPEEMRVKEKELKEVLFNLRFQKSIGQLENSGKITEAKRNIARIKTVVRQIEVEQT